MLQAPDEAVLGCTVQFIPFEIIFPSTSSEPRVADEAVNIPAKVSLPKESIFNFDTPPTCKSKRFPVNEVAVFIARSVPEAEPMKLFNPPANPPLPIEINPDDVAVGGVPKKLSFPFTVIPP